MSKQGFSYSTATASSHITGHGTSSAFKSSVNLDEDWTKISDLAERRRIQNRIAQRNYRKKLKRRLEDLEKRTGSSPASPASPRQVHAELQQQQHRVEKKVQQHCRRSPEILHRQPSPRLLQSYYTPLMEDSLGFSHDSEREGSRTLPLVAYHSCPMPEEIVYPTNLQSQPYRPISSSENSDYLAPVPVTLHSMIHFHEAIKREEDTMRPFKMTYQGLPAMNIHGHQEYDDSNPHTPPTSHSHEHSTTCSQSGYHYPATPLSMPPSPPPFSQI